MRLLLDSHAFLWWVDGGERLSRRARAAIASERNECFVSIASGWEMAIETSLGKLRLPRPIGAFLDTQLAVNRFRLLAVELSHLERVSDLPFHHRDPFDRLLVAQALEEQLSVISADRVFARYGVKRTW